MVSRAKTFAVTLIKPSRYDNDGYVIQWRKSCVPSNSLGCLYGLTRDCAEPASARPGRRDRLSRLTTSRTCIMPVEKLIGDMRAADGALLCLVGVQSNQFPRAMHIARRFRAAGIPVAIGGFHVSGCLSMLKEIPADIQEAIDIGCTIFAGEAEEGRFEDAAEGSLGGQREARLQLHEASAEPGRRADRHILPGLRARPHRRHLRHLRFRPRLPLPVLVLLHHQRAGPQIRAGARPTTSRR